MIGLKKTIQNFFVFGLCMLYLYVLASCKPQAEALYDVYNTKTLRSSALEAVESVDWASVQEEGGETVQAEEHTIRLPAGNSDNAAALFIAGISGGESVYPAAEDFTSLDTRMIPPTAYKLCENLIEGCIKKDLKADFFVSRYEFLKIVYEYELKRLPAVKSGIIGKARIDGKGIFEIPIRLATEDGFVYLSAYLVPKGGESTQKDVFKIEQLVFEEKK